MTYTTLRDTVGRKPVLIIEMDLDRCDQALYGGGLLSPQQGTCTANLANKCFHTRKTCQDTPNYINSSSVSPITPLTLQFSDRLIEGEGYFPCITSTKLSPVEIAPGQSFSKRASITITFQDFPHHDRGIDPYVSTRSYTPEDQGTFFGKLIARNPHYQGRELRVKSGYVDDPFSTSDLKTQYYIIESMTLGKKGRVTVVAKDILKLADDERALAPVASTGQLIAAITAGATSLTVTSGTESEYSDYIRIGDEVIYVPVASRGSPANVFPITTRGAWNTTATAHSAADAVQECKHIDGINVRDVIDDLLVNYAGISSTFINATEWDAEEALWLGSAQVTALITEPTGVKSLIDELSEQTMVYIWWDAENQDIRLKAIAPIADRTITFTDDDNFQSDPDIKIEQEDRVSRVLIYYAPRTPIAFKEPKDFDALYGFIGAGEESADQFNDIRVKKIFARWIISSALAVQTGSRTRNQFRDPPKFITFSVDAKDSFSVVGDYIDLDTRSLQDADGSNLLTAVQVLKTEEDASKASGTHYKYKCQATQFTGRYARIMANSSPAGDYSTATDTQKATGAYIVATGETTFSDGQEAYKIA